MDQWLVDPIIQSVIAPVVVAFLATGILAFVLGRTVGARIAAAAVPVGFLVSYWITVGWPPFPPVSSSQKIIYVVVFGAGVGALFDLVGRRDAIARIGTVVWPVLIVGWLGWRELTSPSLLGVATMVALCLGGIAIFAGLHTSRGGQSAPTITLLVGALGASLVALIGSSASISQLSIGLAAASGGFLLWNWPKSRFSFGTAALFGGAGALVALVSALTLFASASKLALILLIPVFFADRLAVRLPMASKPAVGALVLGVVCLVPAAIAVLAAYLSSEGGSGYAYLMDVSR